jgi:hypothetical protein
VGKRESKTQGGFTPPWTEFQKERNSRTCSWAWWRGRSAALERMSLDGASWAKGVRAPLLDLPRGPTQGFSSTHPSPGREVEVDEGSLIEAPLRGRLDKGMAQGARGGAHRGRHQSTGRYIGATQ